MTFIFILSTPKWIIANNVIPQSRAVLPLRSSARLLVDVASRAMGFKSVLGERMRQAVLVCLTACRRTVLIIYLTTCPSTQ